MGATMLAAEPRAERLHTAAVELTGLSEFGCDDYSQGLDLLLDSVAAHPGLRAADAGIDAFLTGVLASRLYSEQGWRDRPEVLHGDLGTPLVIIGVPRTGTTLLHQILAMDERFQVLENWLIDQPTVRPPRDSWPAFPGYHRAVARASAEDLAQRQKHHVEATSPDECIRLMTQTMISNMFGSMWAVPEYDEYYLATDHLPSYLRYADNLRLIGANDPRPWLLKNPSHVQRLSDLVTAFPGARVVQTHRDPCESVPSVASLLAGRQQKLGDSFDPERIGRRELHAWSTALDDADRARTERRIDVHDVYFRDLEADPLAVVEGVYAAFGLELSDDSRRRMRAFATANPRGRHGTHVYRGADFGLSEKQIRAAFAGYLDRHPRATA